MNWTDKFAIVTGGASGIGEATVRAFAEAGVGVGILDINSDRGEGLADELRSNGKLAEFLTVDVSDPDACQIAATNIHEKFGHIHFLVNSAVSFISKGLDATPDDWKRSYGVNVLGGAYMAQACHPFMKQSGGGAIVNISSISGHIAQRNRWTYNASKGAVIMMTKCQALDLAPDGIRVNVVSPGWTWTPEVEKAATGGREKWEPIWGKFAMQRRIGEASEVASAILFLCSDAASFITGAELPVDGGYIGLGSEGLGEWSSFAGSE